MPRIRSIKPDIWNSVQVMRLSHSARLLFLVLITQADDEGRGTCEALRLKSVGFPADPCTPADVEPWLGELTTQGLVIVYESSRHGRLYALPTWRDHQRINRPTASRYPPPPGAHQGAISERSLSTHGAINERSVSTHYGSDRSGSEWSGSGVEKEGKGEEREERETLSSAEALQEQSQEVLRGRKPEPEQDKAEGRRRVLKALEALPDSTPNQLAQVAKVPLSIVHQALAARPC